MKGKISKTGILHISRGGKFIAQLCPFVTRTKGENCVKCGGWCPLFGEPWKEKSDSPIFDMLLEAYKIPATPANIRLELCHNKKLVFEEFTDERSELINQTSQETAKTEPVVNAKQKVEELHTNKKKSALDENFKIVEIPKKKRGRPRKVVEINPRTVGETAKEKTVVPPQKKDEIAQPRAQMQKQEQPEVEKVPVYHEPCKTCRKSCKDSNGNYPMCKDGYFEKTTRGTEVCPLWWQR